MENQKPIPLKNQDNSPYWEGADRHELILQKCDSCKAYSHPPGPSCAKCGSTELSWERQGNDIHGKVYSYIISYRPFLPGFQDDLPLIIAIVELEKVKEVKLIGNILSCSPEDIAIGMPVKMIWKKMNEERSIPQWISE
ncbi:Zn-ribbon domain-containing OB-fold protein [Peribacillus psychrosaccharolyticus]|uniref:Zn-ribbon domain-containing OB-fold protein n=1 Tax=Peribacillus psychrosaccharolyticus TaxID=1407 RepID=A0A974NNL0_PERPY|nr:Zn-ribbon domain-containing OB-fold protein [Peribacillus psychrosaccharolyticus]MEC2057395.1 Zn-ribbon domain-containing OB-fold protein [Peribacillus psychrosaccharolyticus]MED3742779.1 Zn-ribbon domain-containing OB-fold protein [Peribacillus psychrosaccharolyticus]QQT01145.1 Zn-ribbon domain-containing OB-fold protein [Peribacillus psychrosaccharolyticus]